MEQKRIIFALTGASGMPLAKAMLNYYFHLPDLMIHLIISNSARTVIRVENKERAQELEKFAFAVYGALDLTAGPASGSWQHAGMIICPCSMGSLGAIANGCGTNLIHRAADVTLKERRPLVLVIRETPLNRIHLENMLRANDAGAVIMPFSPAFYTDANSQETIFKQFAGRVLDQLAIPHDLCVRWRDA